MIKYQLACCQGHAFEAWFRSAHTFEVLAAMHDIECPFCGSLNIDKLALAPKTRQLTLADVSDADTRNQLLQSTEVDANEYEVEEVLRKFRAEVEARSERIGLKTASDVSEDDVALVPRSQLPDETD
ncbi:MAG: DUF1178 family protein [Alphaproteobacteria bacterium]|nr:DUF1178 family protein [Alphaproteobacteria bacterium]